MLTRADVHVVQQKVLPGTIDGHKPLLVTFRIRGPQGWFRLTVVCANWGRGYAPGEFRANVEAVLGRTEEREYVVLLLQEIDEADSENEHKVIREELPDGCTLVQWWTREPIVVWPGIEVKRERKAMTMDQGSAIGANKGTGPRRFFTSCIIVIEGLRIGIGNQHPHKLDRKSSKANQKIVKKARAEGVRVTREEVHALVALSQMCVYGGDMNDPDYPRVHPKEQVAMERGLDTIRYVVG